jgi:superfamily I DNA/RNA helicase
MELIQTPSKYQKRIYKEITDTNNSINVISKAGSGKTTTLVGCLELFPKDLDVCMFAFNKSIVEELKRRLPDRPKNVQITTLHSFGSQVIFNHIGKVTLSENKSFKTATWLYKTWHEQKQVDEQKWTYCDRVSQIVNLMKLTMTSCILEDVEELALKYGIMFIGNEIEHAMEVFEVCFNNLGTIDFNDMLFIPAIKNFKMKKFDVVLLDECQDCNVAMQTIVKKVLKPNGRLISVGDEMQSIYGFAGSDYESFQKIKNIVPGTISLPLSVSYRCAKAIIKEAKKIVPDIEHSENAIEGEVREGSLEEIEDGDMVLCRNVKPLVILLLHLVENGVRANIRGRDIGKNMVNAIEKTKKTNVKDLIKQMRLDKNKLKEKLMKRGVYRPDNHDLLRQASERIEIVKILAKKAGTVKGVIDLLNTIFIDGDIKGVTLSTVHKSKGDEAKNVFILERHLIPSQYATTKDQIQQEKNLLYVAVTRAKEKLIYINDFDDINEKEEDPEEEE